MPVLTEFPFGGGVNEHISKRMLPDGVLAYCENFRPGLRGELVTRPGYTALSMDALAVGDFTALDITSYGAELVAVGRTFGTTGPRELFVYHGHSSTWAWRGQLQATTGLAISPVSEVQEVWQAPLGVTTNQVDLAYANGYLCCVYTDPDSAIGYIHVFRDDGRTFFTQQLTGLDSIRCVGVGNFLVVVSLTTGGALQIRTCDTASGQSFSTLQTARSGVAVGLSIGAWDAAPVENASPQFLIAYKVGNDVEWQRWNASTVAQVGSTVTVTDSTARHIAIQGCDTETINVIYRNNTSGNYILRTYNETTNVLAFGPSTLTASLAQRQALIARQDSNSIHIGLRGSGTLRGRVDYYQIGTAAHAVQASYVLNEVNVTGKLYTHNGDSEGTYAGAPGLHYFAGDLTFASSGLVGIKPGPLVHAHLDHGVAIPIGLPASTSNVHLTSTPGDGSGRFFCVTLRSEANVIGQGADRGVPIVHSFEVGSEERRQFCEFGGLLYQAGGVLGVFDGRENVDGGFPTPEATATASSAGGGLTGAVATAATLTTGPVQPPAVVLDGQNILISVDNGGLQVVVFNADDTTAANIAAEINGDTTGITATAVGATVQIVSDTTGVASALNVQGTPAIMAALGFFSGQTAAGSLTSVVYRHRFVHVWKDKIGNTHRSAPSPIVTTTMASGSNRIVLTLATAHSQRRNDGTSTYGSLVQTEVYRTEANGTVFRLVDAVENTGVYAIALTYNDTLADSTLRSRATLYTQAVTPEENVPAPACGGVVPGNERMLLVQLADPYAYQFGKLLLPEEPANFPHPSRAAYRGRLHEPIVAAVWDDSRWVLFTKKKPYQISGEGPGATGQGTFFSAKGIDDAPGGAIDWKGVLRTPKGVFFQLAEDKIYALRGNSLVWAGERVQQTLATYPNITASVYIRAQQLAVFACQNDAGSAGVLLICDQSTDEDEWYVDAVGAVDALAEYLGRIAYIKTGIVYLQDEASGTGAHVDGLARTGRFRLNTVMGFGALTGVGVLGENLGGTYSLFVDISLDDGVSWGTGPIGTLNITPLTHAVGATIELIKAPPRQRLEGFMLRFRTGNGSSSSAGIKLNALVTETEKAYALARHGSGVTQ